MARLARFFGKSRADRRRLALAAALYVGVAIAVRLLPFGRVQRLLAAVAAIGPRPREVAHLDARVAQAVSTVAAFVPGANCLSDALVAQCLLARHGREATLCFGLARVTSARRPFDAHAWLEHRGTPVIGVRAIAYDPLRHPSRCVSSPSPR